jgi:hypothetical protein
MLNLAVRKVTARLLKVKDHTIKTHGEVEVYHHPFFKLGTILRRKSSDSTTPSTGASSVKFPIQPPSHFVHTHLGSDNHVINKPRQRQAACE